MPTRTSSLILVLCLAPLPLGCDGCGSTHQALTEGGGAGAGDGSGDGDAGDGDGDGDQAGDDGGDGDTAGGTSSTGQGGSQDGTGGDGDGASGDGDGDGDGASGVSLDPTGGLSEEEAAEVAETAERLDPHAAERRQAAMDYCALLETHTCLRYVGIDGPGSPRERCERETEIAQSTNFGDGCFEAWTDMVACMTDAPWSCPCSGDDCFLHVAGTSTGALDGACEDALATLTECRADAGDSQEVEGSSGPCRYFWSDVEGCTIHCNRGEDRIYEGECDGPLGGAQRCNCSLNGVTLRDPANEAGGTWADNCRAAARQFADGYCERIHTCCFTWQSERGETCTCTSDPSAGGYDSCEAAAEAGDGEVVDLCPQYRIPWAQFP